MVLLNLFTIIPNFTNVRADYGVTVKVDTMCLW